MRLFASILEEVTKNKTMGYTDYEWRKLHKGWQYEEDAPECSKWQKDRKELFAKNGNGWWWFTACKATHTREYE